MNNDEAKQKAGEWAGEAGGELLPLLTANELAGIVNEAIFGERVACVAVCEAQAILQDDAFRFGLTPTDGDLAEKCAEGIKARGQDNLRKPSQENRKGNQ
jgi:hypothetical protein